MEFSQVVADRYSCKKYDGTPVPADVLVPILTAGHMAPTAKNQQPQRVHVIQSEEGLAKVDQLTKCRYGASTVLMVAYDANNTYVYPGGKHASSVEDATLVATYMMLAAADAGVDSCWVNNFDPEEAAKLFGLPENEVVVMLLDLGYAAEGAGPLPNHFSRKELSETVSFV